MADRVEFLLGDALEVIAALPGPFEFVLLDIWKGKYSACLEALLPKLAPGAIIAADNMIRPESHLDQVRAYQERVRATPGLETVTVPIGSGVEISRLVG